MRLNLQRLIMYAKGSDVLMQREVAEQLANQAVKRTWRKWLALWGVLFRVADV